MLVAQIAERVTLEIGLVDGKVRRPAHLVLDTVTPQHRCAIEISGSGWAFTPEPAVQVTADQRAAISAAVTSAVAQYGLAE
jgi:hypothetical protein